MKNKVNHFCTLAIFLAISLCSCSQIDVEVQSTSSDTHTENLESPVIEVIKTPTPQAEFNVEKIVGSTTTNKQNVKPETPTVEVPRYSVDAVYDSATDSYVSVRELVTSVEGSSSSFSEDESVENLFDGYESSKYCCSVGENGLEITFSLRRSVPLIAYSLATGNDTAEYPERNPYSWELFGSTDGEEWVSLATVEAGELPAANYTYKAFLLSAKDSYSWYRISFQMGEASEILQLSEIGLYVDKDVDLELADSYLPSSSYTSLHSYIDLSTVSGPDSGSTHTVDCLFDNLAESDENGSNKYCIGRDSATVSWQMTQSVVVTDYVIYTSNDTETYPERNPKTWILYGSEDGNEWNVIDSVSDGNLPSSNYTPVLFHTENQTAYSYYKLEIQSLAGDGNVLQFTEICLYTAK
jgi:hypothetical protein